MQDLPASAAGPFAALSLIGAPAILTNAATLLALSTSNRLHRAVDLARDAARELESMPEDAPHAATDRRVREMSVANLRSILLLRALRAVYAAVAGFAGATLLSLLGAVFAPRVTGTFRAALETGSIAVGFVAVLSIVWAAVLLVRDTQIAVTNIGVRVEEQRARFAPAAPTTPGRR